MVAIKFDLTNILKLQSQLEKLIDPEYLLRPLALDEVDLMTKRIHIDGLNANEQPIGEYNPAYLKYVRIKKWNRDSSKKIISSLTRQQENDWNVVETEGGYGIGFQDEINFKKARWLEENKEQEIFSLSPSELRFADERIKELIEEAFNENK